MGAFFSEVKSKALRFTIPLYEFSVANIEKGNKPTKMQKNKETVFFIKSFTLIYCAPTE